MNFFLVILLSSFLKIDETELELHFSSLEAARFFHLDRSTAVKVVVGGFVVTAAVTVTQLATFLFNLILKTKPLFNARLNHRTLSLNHGLNHSSQRPRSSRGRGFYRRGFTSTPFFDPGTSGVKTSTPVLDPGTSGVKTSTPIFLTPLPAR